MGKKPRDTSTQAYGYRWVILGILWITYIVVFLQRLSVGPLAPFLKEDLSVSSAQVGIIMSAASLGYMFTLFPAGWIVDKIGVRYPIVMAEILAGTSMIVVYFATSYVHLLFLMLITGLACGFLMPSTSRGIVEWFAVNERATAMGFKQTAVNVGGIISAAILPPLALSLGWRYGFVILGIIAIIVGIITWILYKDPPIAVSPEDGYSRNQTDNISMAEILKNRDIWLLGCAGLCLAWVEMAMIGHLVLFLTEEILISVVAAGGILAMAEAAGAIARPGGGFISDHLLRGNRKKVLVAMSILVLISCLIIGLFGTLISWGIYPLIFLLGLGGIGFGGVYFTLLAEYGGRYGTGKAIGLGNTISMTGSVLGPIVFGLIVDKSGSYQWAWLSLSGIGALCLVLLIGVKENKNV